MYFLDDTLVCPLGKSVDESWVKTKEESDVIRDEIFKRMSDN